jgi:hypothetical protein
MYALLFSRVSVIVRRIVTRSRIGVEPVVIITVQPVDFGRLHLQ